MGTQKQMSVTIRSSGGLSQSQIDEMLKQAESMKQEDQAKKEMIEIKNESESLIHNTEKQMKENDDKLPQDLKDRVRADINALNEALASNDLETSKNAIEKFRNSAMDIGRTIYQNASQETSNQQQQEQTKEKPNEEQPKEEEKKEE